ncbi:MAG TPA: DUF4446 family protein [Chloroflexi bacterium]|nr:DUF4446 family protein [Chloroflexota bacterium]
MHSLLAICDSYGVYLLLLMLLSLILLAAWAALLHRRLSKLRQDYALLITGADGEDLGRLFSAYTERAEATARRVEDLSERLQRLESQLNKSLQRVGLIRFDAFEGSGGEQSFSLAVLDAESDGVVVSSLHGRGQSRVYAKPIESSRSGYSLSAEEKLAIAQAAGNHIDNG